MNSQMTSIRNVIFEPLFSNFVVLLFNYIFAKIESVNKASQSCGEYILYFAPLGFWMYATDNNFRRASCASVLINT